jgi:aryl-alcohol dehydrogenase-like predicted oxidoreductase
LERKELGASGVEVSRLWLGAMTFGSRMPPISNVDATIADAMVERALGAGVNVVDTADAYSAGESEEILAPLLARHRDDLLVATKAGFGGADGAPLSPENVRSSVEKSLRRLGVDHVDILTLHRPDRSTPIDDSFDELDALVDRGLVRAVSVSNWRAGETAYAVGRQRATHGVEPTSVQVYWSLVGRDVEQEIVPTCAELGLGVVVWSPLAAGYLAARDDGRRAAWPFPPVDDERGPAVLAAVRTVADELGVPPARVAIAWLLHRAEVTSVVVGASSIAQLDDNLAADELALDARHLATLDDASAVAPIYPRWWDTAMGVE